MRTPGNGSHRLRIGVIGLGPWGRNLARAFGRTPRCEVVAVCDSDGPRLAAASAVAARRELEVERVIESRDIDAVVVATPASTHAPLAVAALDAGKHVFVEKPMALTVRDASHLVRLAEGRGRRLMVGHVLEHHPGVLALSKLIADGKLGLVHRVASYRFGTAPPREEGSWWSLAPHDIGLARRFSMREVTSVAVRRQRAPAGEVITARLQLGSVAADIQVGGGHSDKVRRTVVLGSLAAAELDDCRCAGKLRLIENREVSLEGIDAASPRGRVIPFADDEPLAREAAAFVDGVLDDQPFFGDGASALHVTAVLAAGDLSMSLGHSVLVNAEAEPAGPGLAALAP